MRRPDARRVALDVLLRVDEGTPSDRALDRALRRAGLEAADRALATELVYGVLRRRASLDGMLAQHSRRPIDTLDVGVLAALRLGAYQLRHLDRVPAHAAVDATVEAIKRRKRPAAGFVNAVLRALLRAGVDETDDDPFADVPIWWARRWRERYGDERSAAWFRGALRPSPLVVRPHPRAMEVDELSATLGDHGIELEPARHAPGALRITRGTPLESPLLAAGAFAVRGEASQLVAALLPVRAGDRVLDACAGRGGKSLQIAEDTDASLIVANDLTPWRARTCARQARAAGIDHVRPLVADLSMPGPFRARFDAALVDAPCSGLGTIRRRPELKWRNHPGRLARLAELQRTILDTAAATLSAGGRLLYATCSTEPEENERVVEAVLDRRPDLERRPILLPEGVDARLVGDDGFLRTYPDWPEMDGFFAALLVRD